MSYQAEAKKWRRMALNLAENRTIVQILMRRRRWSIAASGGQSWPRSMLGLWRDRLELRCLGWIDRVQSRMEKSIRDERRALRQEREDRESRWWRE